MGSALWATSQQAFLLGSNIVVSIVLARTLPLADFGVFSLATTYAALGATLAVGGLSALGMKALLDDEERQAATMSGLILIREGFGIIAYLGMLGISLTGDSSVVTEATALALIVLLARAFDPVDFWFQSRLNSRRSASIRIIVNALMLGVRIGAALAGAGLWIFLLLFVLESFAVTGALIWRYLREPASPGFGVPRPSVARAMLGGSWLLLLSGVANQVNLRADQVIIQAKLGSAAVGQYAVAARLSEMTYFLPVVFMTATFPVMVASLKEHGSAGRRFEQELQRSYDRACWGGVAIMLIILLVGPTAIGLLYGPRFEASQSVLRIHVLALPFVFMAAVYSKWIILEGLLMASLIRHGLAALVNIGLNLLLVPAHGLEGAAVATVVSYGVASYLACFVGPSMRPAGIAMSRALLLPVRSLARLRSRSS